MNEPTQEFWEWARREATDADLKAVIFQLANLMDAERFKFVEKHQDFTNYETFSIGLWVDNDRALSLSVPKMAKLAADSEPDPELKRVRAADTIKGWVEKCAPDIPGDGPWGSLLHAAISEVDWLDLADHWLNADA